MNNSVINESISSFQPPENVVDFSTDLGCQGTSIYQNDVSGKLVTVQRGNCSFSEKAQLAQEHGGIGLLVVNTPDQAMV